MLRHSIGDKGGDDGGFCAGCIRHDVAARDSWRSGCFRLRAENVLNGLSPRRPRARALSGYLIGAELAATKPYWLGQEVAIAGARRWLRPTPRALKPKASQARVLMPAPLTRAGLARVHAP